MDLDSCLKPDVADYSCLRSRTPESIIRDDERASGFAASRISSRFPTHLRYGLNNASFLVAARCKGSFQSGSLLIYSHFRWVYETSMKRTAWIIVGLALAGLGIVFYLWSIAGRTPAINEPNSIASLERIRIGGVDQYILIRGNDASLPVLLFLHGGPGMPGMYLAHAFQRELEKDFVVVQWDRRGAGKSHREDISSTLNSEQLVADAVELANVLRNRSTKLRFIWSRVRGARIWECW